jgi:glutaredoxin-like protein NrdH
MSITVFSTPSCVQCRMTYRALDAQGLPYEVVDVTAAPEALAEVRALGYSQAPVVRVGEEHWSGFRPDRIQAVAERLAVVSA